MSAPSEVRQASLLSEGHHRNRLYHCRLQPEPLFFNRTFLTATQTCLNHQYRLI